MALREIAAPPVPFPPPASHITAHGLKTNHDEIQFSRALQSIRWPCSGGLDSMSSSAVACVREVNTFRPSEQGQISRNTSITSYAHNCGSNEAHAQSRRFLTLGHGYDCDPNHLVLSRSNGTMGKTNDLSMSLTCIIPHHAARHSKFSIARSNVPWPH